MPKMSITSCHKIIFTSDCKCAGACEVRWRPRWKWLVNSVLKKTGPSLLLAYASMQTSGLRSLRIYLASDATRNWNTHLQTPSHGNKTQTSDLISPTYGWFCLVYRLTCVPVAYTFSSHAHTPFLTDILVDCSNNFDVVGPHSNVIIHTKLSFFLQKKINVSSTSTIHFSWIVLVLNTHSIILCPKLFRLLPKFT